MLRFRADTQNVVFWDPNIKNYVLYLRGWNVDVEGNWKNRLRRVVRMTTKDLSQPIPITPSAKGKDPANSKSMARIVSDEIGGENAGGHRRRRQRPAQQRCL